MTMLKCSNNHYYDDKRRDSCPYCAKLNAAEEQKSSLNERQTSYVFLNEEDNDSPVTEAYGESVSEFEKTIGIYTHNNHLYYTTGWIVCKDGAEKGKSYAVHAGRNFAGRSVDMDIVLSDDSLIARNKHFSIVYDPKDNTFYLVPGSGCIFLNGDFIKSAKRLQDGDELIVGASRYIFIPYCREGRDWN